MDNNINKEFEKIIQQKLVNHSLPVDADIWKGIEAKLKPAPKKILPFWYWISSASAVAVVLLLLGIFNFTNTNTNKELAINKTTDSENILTENQKTNSIHTEKLTLNSNIKKQNSKKTLVQKSNKSRAPEIIIPHTETAQKLTDNSSEISKQNELGKTEFVTENKQIAQTKESVENGDSKPADEKKKLIAVLEEPKLDWQDEFKKESENEWVLIASLGSGGSGASANSNAEMDQPLYKSSILKAPTMNTSILAPSDFSERSYNAPISFGFTANKKILKNLSIETGISYTYLYTMLKDSRATADFSLHYVGIPLNLMYKIWNNNKWSVYTSAGIMAEKGIWSVYRQDEFVGNQTITTKVTKKIPGMQWSVNGAVGLTYAILDEMDIYFEPKLSKFFENDQPISIRTENKLVVGISGGFRWNF
jgi:hypothetical protein